MEKLQDILQAVDDVVWGPAMLIFLVGTGIFLTVRVRFLTWKNLPYALKSVFGREARETSGEGDISPFSALTTALASTIGTGNIVGVATAMVAGGPGAVIWMWISACFGLTSKFSECLLAILYRTVNAQGEMTGGPMYTMLALKNKRLGKFLGVMFAVFAVFASFGIGNMTQANSISSALSSSFDISDHKTGFVLAVLVLIIVLGGIKNISRVSQVIVPAMAIMYVVAALIVIIGNIQNVPHGLAEMIRMAFSVKSAAGGVGGAITASMMSSMRYGIARGVFSNEAGMGSAAITAAAARTDDPVKQAYISMTGTFFDTLVVCSITALLIASSGMLGMADGNGNLLEGAPLTIAAFETVLGEFGSALVSIAITLFAFSTILGWEYNGEKAFEFLVKNPKYCLLYRIFFSMLTFLGATSSLKIVWSFSDIANGMMAVPNLICLLAMSGVVAREIKDYQKIVDDFQGR